jgi:putative transposase
LFLEAAWRFQLLAPLVDSRISKEEKSALRKRLLTEKHEHPWRGATSLSSRTIRRWCAQFRKDKLAGLTTRLRADLNSCRKFSSEILDAARKIVEEDPRRTVSVVIHLLEASFPESQGTIARSTLDRHLRRLGKPGKEPGKSYLQFEATEANNLWQGDILHGPMVLTEEGKDCRAKVVCWLDDHSRYVCHLEAFADERLPAVETALKRAILKHGLPIRILVDNGKVYSCKSFLLACSQLGIQKIHSAPYHPESKGKIERFFRTLRDGLLNELENVEKITLERLNRLLQAWLANYHSRSHSSLKMAPAQRYKPPLHRPVSLQNLEESFWQWDLRLVSPQGRIEFSGNHYFTDLSLAGQRLVVRYDPYDLSRIILWRDGRRLAEAAPEQLLQSHRPRKLKPIKDAKSEATERFLDALEKSQIERLGQEINLIQLPDVQEEENL